MDPFNTPGPNNQQLPPSPPAAGPSMPGPSGGVPPLPPPPSASWLPPTVPVSPPGGAGDGPTQNTSDTGAFVGAPENAEDGDVIETEWVSGAKEIVERTKQDPYLQTKELHKFKAEYMKKRYNKIIEPVEE